MSRVVDVQNALGEDATWCRTVIVAHAVSDGPVRLADIEETFCVSKRTAQRALNLGIECGLLDRETTLNGIADTRRRANEYHPAGSVNKHDNRGQPPTEVNIP